MEYMVLLYSDESMHPEMEPGSPEFQAMMGEWMAYNQRLIDGGHFVSGGSLQDSQSATVLTKSFDGTTSMTDGPYADTKEQLGGYYVIQAADLDEALPLAEAVPIPAGRFEIRPIAFRPDAD